jgi:hypothetical protein
VLIAVVLQKNADIVCLQKSALVVHGLNAVVGMPLMASEKDNHLLDSPEEYL